MAVVDEVRDSNTVGDDVNQGAFTEILGQPPSAENRLVRTATYAPSTGAAGGLFDVEVDA